MACAARRLRGTWMTAAVVALTISYGGDAIGHVMQLVAYRRTHRGAPQPEPERAAVGRR